MTNVLQLKLIVAFVTGSLFDNFWDKCRLESFLLTTSIRGKDLRFLFTITIEGVLYKVFCTYKVDDILKSKITKEQIVAELYKKALTTVPGITQGATPVTDIAYDPVAPEDDILPPEESLEASKRSLQRWGWVKE